MRIVYVYAPVNLARWLWAIVKGLVCGLAFGVWLALMIPLSFKAHQMHLWDRKWKPELRAEWQSFLTDPINVIKHEGKVLWHDITDPFQDNSSKTSRTKHKS